MRELLSALVLVTGVPLLALAVIMFQQLVTHQRQATRDALMSQAQALAALVDNEIDTHMAVAATLAASPQLQQRDLEGFERLAKQALQVIPASWVTLADPAGQLLMTTLGDAPRPLPIRPRRELTAQAWATGEPQISNVLTGALTRRRVMFIEYPIFADGAPAYILILTIEPERVRALIDKTQHDAEAVIGIIDRQFNFVSRFPGHEEHLGTPASAGWRASIASAPRGFSESKTLEGRQSLTAYAPTREGWTAGIALPLDVLDAPIRRVWLSMGLIGLMLALVSFFLGHGLGWRIHRVAAELVETAGKVGEGHVVAPRTFPILEGTALSQALSDTSHELARRQTALRESEARLREALEASEAGVWSWDAISDTSTWDAIYERHYGFPSGHRPGSGAWIALVHADDRQRLVERIEQMKISRGDDIWDEEFRVMHPIRGERWMRSTGRASRDAEGCLIKMAGLNLDVTERKHREAQVQLLLKEVNHRAKNMLGMVLAIAHQTAAKDPGEFVARFSQRIQALSANQDLLIRNEWLSVEIHDLVRAQLAPFVDLAAGRVRLDGPDISCSATSAQSLGMALHELATNAAKHGAFSNQTGCVDLSWQIAPGVQPYEERFAIRWTERDGPPVSPPMRNGFGHTVISTMMKMNLRADVQIDYAATGLVWSLQCPAQKIIERRSAKSCKS